MFDLRLDRMDDGRFQANIRIGEVSRYIVASNRGTDLAWVLALTVWRLRSKRALPEGLVQLEQPPERLTVQVIRWEESADVILYHTKDVRALGKGELGIRLATHAGSSGELEKPFHRSLLTLIEAYGLYDVLPVWRAFPSDKSFRESAQALRHRIWRRETE